MSKPEYLEFRCCMCPNIGEPLTVCPGVSYAPHHDDSPCRFVKAYKDSRGWKYKVMGGLGESNFKARYQKPEKHGSTGWKCCPNMKWQKSFDAAQKDLNARAKANGWEEYNNAIS